MFREIPLLEPEVPFARQVFVVAGQLPEGDDDRVDGERSFGGGPESAGCGKQQNEERGADFLLYQKTISLERQMAGLKKCCLFPAEPGQGLLLLLSLFTTFRPPGRRLLDGRAARVKNVRFPWRFNSIIIALASLSLQDRDEYVAEGFLCRSFRYWSGPSTSSPV